MPQSALESSPLPTHKQARQPVWSKSDFQKQRLLSLMTIRKLKNSLCNISPQWPGLIASLIFVATSNSEPMKEIQTSILNHHIFAPLLGARLQLPMPTSHWLPALEPLPNSKALPKPKWQADSSATASFFYFLIASFFTYFHNVLIFIWQAQCCDGGSISISERPAHSQ